MNGDAHDLDEVDRRLVAMREARDEADLAGDADTYVAASEAIDELLELRLAVARREDVETIRVPPRVEAV